MEQLIYGLVFYIFFGARSEVMDPQRCRQPLLPSCLDGQRELHCGARWPKRASLRRWSFSPRKEYEATFSLSSSLRCSSTEACKIRNWLNPGCQSDLVVALPDSPKYLSPALRLHVHVATEAIAKIADDLTCHSSFLLHLSAAPATHITCTPALLQAHNVMKTIEAWQVPILCHSSLQ
ncbi:hypothetical protein LIA77_04445 [Sarocladium implicatum]|nr:hypothetical protein LIA77_04445 [Sarocladium implicatum]